MPAASSAFDPAIAAAADVATSALAVAVAESVGLASVRLTDDGRAC